MGDAPPTVEDDTRTHVPPRPLAALVLLTTLAAFSYFTALGIQRGRAGSRSLAGTLLRVDERDGEPVLFSLPSLDGKEISLSGLAGKTVFLNFWATWCPPCIEEMPSLRQLSERIGKREDFVMLLVSADDSWQPVRKFFEDDAPSVAVLLDEGGEIAKRYGTTMFPETYLLVDGRVRAFIEGPRDWSAWFAESYVRSFLDGGV